MVTVGNFPRALGFLGIGWYVATCIVLGVVAGLWLDGRAHTEPIFALVGLGFGLAAAIYGGYRMLTNVLGPGGRQR